MKLGLIWSQLTWIFFRCEKRATDYSRFFSRAPGSSTDTGKLLTPKQGKTPSETVQMVHWWVLLFSWETGSSIQSDVLKPPWLVDIGVIVDASSGNRHTPVVPFPANLPSQVVVGDFFERGSVQSEEFIILWLAICFATIDRLTAFLEYSVATFPKTCGISPKGLHSRSSHVGFRWLRCVQQRNIIIHGNRAYLSLEELLVASPTCSTTT